MTLSILLFTTAVNGILIRARIHDAPDRRASCRNHSHDTPVRAEILDAPDDGDDDGHEGERAAVAEADEGGCYVGEGWVGDWEWGGKEEVA